MGAGMSCSGLKVPVTSYGVQFSLALTTIADEVWLIRIWLTQGEEH